MVLWTKLLLLVQQACIIFNKAEVKMTSCDSLWIKLVQGEKLSLHNNQSTSQMASLQLKTSCMVLIMTQFIDNPCGLHPQFLPLECRQSMLIVTIMECTVFTFHSCHLIFNIKKLLYSGNLSREKMFCKSFLHENLIFNQFVKVFSLESLSLYTWYIWYNSLYHLHFAVRVQQWCGAVQTHLAGK